MNPLTVPRDRWPLCVTIDDAAEYAGVGEKTMREWANSLIDPIPTIEIGSKKMIRVAALDAYLESKSVRRR